MRGSRTPSIDETDAESPNDGEHGSAAIPARRAANMAAGAPAGGCGAPTKSKTPPNKAGLRLLAAVWDAAVSVRVCLRACVCARACVTSRSSHYQQLANTGVRPEYPRSARRVPPHRTLYDRSSCNFAHASVALPCSGDAELARAAGAEQQPTAAADRGEADAPERRVRGADGPGPRAGAARSIALRPHSRAAFRPPSQPLRSGAAAPLPMPRPRPRPRPCCGLQAKLRAERLRRDEAELKARARVARGIPQGPPWRAQFC